MRTPRVTASLACFAVAAVRAISGCATAVPEVRTADDAQRQDGDAIGDRPISVSSGDPGSQDSSIIPRAPARPRARARSGWTRASTPRVDPCPTPRFESRSAIPRAAAMSVCSLTNWAASPCTT